MYRCSFCWIYLRWNRLMLNRRTTVHHPWLILVSLESKRWLKYLWSTLQMLEMKSSWRSNLFDLCNHSFELSHCSKHCRACRYRLLFCTKITFRKSVLWFSRSIAQGSMSQSLLWFQTMRWHHFEIQIDNQIFSIGLQ